MWFYDVTQNGNSGNKSQNNKIKSNRHQFYLQKFEFWECVEWKKKQDFRLKMHHLQTWPKTEREIREYIYIFIQFDCVESVWFDIWKRKDRKNEVFGNFYFSSNFMCEWNFMSTWKK